MMTDSITCYEEPSAQKRRRLSDWMIRMVLPEGEDVMDGPLITNDAQVICLSQEVREVYDPLVDGRDCVLADGSKSRGWSGTLLKDFMADVSFEYLNIQSTVVVCFEAYKNLEKDFTNVMRSLLNIKEHQIFCEKFRRIVHKASALHGISLSSSNPWVQEAPFGVYAQALKMLYDAVCSTPSEERRIASLREKGVVLFYDILQEGVSALKEDAELLELMSTSTQVAINYVLNRENVKAVIHEWVNFAKLRGERNNVSHPFVASSSPAVWEAAMTLYTKILSNDYSKDFRHVAILGKCKLDSEELSRKRREKRDHIVMASTLLSSDSEDSSS